MPPPSEAALRYAIIDRCLTNLYKPFPTMNDLKYTIERELKTSVSTATIQKDIAQMKKGEDENGYRAPIKFKRSNQGYYYDLITHPNFTIRSLGLNEKESEAIELAASVLQQFKGIKVNDSYNHAIDKLYSSLNIKKSDKDKSLTNAIQPEETTYMQGMEHFENLVKSIKKKIPVSFIHYSYDKKLFKSIIIHPYLMKESNKRWYLVGYSEEHKEVRYFGLDRIYLVLEELGLFPETVTTTSKALFINFGETETLFSLKTISHLRQNGIKVEMYPDATKMAKQFQFAEKKGIQFAVLVGEEEIKQNQFKVKDLISGEQNIVSLNELVEKGKDLLAQEVITKEKEIMEM